MIKNTASQKIGAQLVSATDGSAFTGAVVVAVTVDAGVQAPGSVGAAACAHEGNGYHTYAPAQAETNGSLIAFTFTGSGAVPVTVQVYTRDFVGGRLDANVGAMDPDTIDSTVVAAGTIGASQIATSGATEIADAVWDTLTAAHVVAGSFGLLSARLPAALTGDGNIKADTLRVGGTLQTAGDLVVLLNAIDDFLDTEIAGILAAVDTEVAAILAAVDTEVASILAAVDTEVAAIKAVTDLFVAAHAEPTGVPAANATPLNKLGFVFAALRNKITVTSTKKQYYDDADAALWEKDVSDDGVTYQESEANAP